MCDTNKLHQLSVLTDDVQTKASKIHSFPDQTTSKSFKYTDNYQNDEAVPIPKQISWERSRSPPPPQPIRPIISNTFTVSTTSSSCTPSYSQSLDVDDNDHNGSDMDTSEQSIPIAIHRLHSMPMFSDGQIELSDGVSSITPPANDSESEINNDYNMKLLIRMKSIDESGSCSDWDDSNECNIDIPKLSDTSASSLPVLSIQDDDKKEAETDKVYETNHANEDHKDGEYDIDIPKLSKSSASSLPASPSSPAALKDVEVSRDDLIKTRADETIYANDDRKECVEEIRVIEHGPDLGKVDEQTPMLYIRDNINRNKPPETNVADSSLSPNAIPCPGLPESASLEEANPQTQRQFASAFRQKFDKIVKQKNLHLSKDDGKSKKKKSKTKKVKHYQFVPKSRYCIPRQFTQKLPASIKENINIEENSVYEFIIKMLRIINFKPNENDISKIFDLGLDGIYFRAKRQHPKSAKGKNKWIMDEIVDATEVKQDDPDILRPPTIVNDTQMCYVKAVLELREKLLSIVYRTKWTKMPIYKRKKGGKKTTLQFPKKDFIADFIKCIDNIDLRHIQLIPIVMFDNRDRYWVEYVWIVRIDENTDIGISFAYKSNGNGKGKPSVDVAGIYLDKNQILRQHHVISPSSSPESLSNFTTKFDNLYIGDAQDDENRVKDLQKRWNDAKEENERQKDALIAIKRAFEIY